jgi:hypothetical protein
MSTIIWPFLIYWLVLFVACLVVFVVCQDQVTPRSGLKVASGSLLIALLLTWLRARGEPVSYESMFTTYFAWTVLQGIVWFGVFTLIFQFHPWHALGLGLITMVLVTGLATMGVDSVLAKPAQTAAATRDFVATKPVRQSLSPSAAAAPPAAAEKAK